MSDVIANRPWVEPLEGRVLRAADLLGDVVYVTGTRRSDVIRVSFRTFVGADNAKVDQAYILVNGEESAFNINEFARIVVKANRDADRLRIDETAGELPPLGFVNDAAGCPTLVRGVLDVEGGAGNDTIRIYRDAGPTGDIVVDVNGFMSRYGSDLVSRLLVFGNRRGDDILIGQTGAPLGLGVIAVGGDGDDVVRGGDGNDTIVAGGGDHDTLWGGGGNDVFPAGGWAIHGDDGDDVVKAYANIGTFTGGAGHDRLASGFARYLLSTHFPDFDSAEDAYAQVP